MKIKFWKSKRTDLLDKKTVHKYSRLEIKLKELTNLTFRKLGVLIDLLNKHNYQVVFQTKDNLQLTYADISIIIKKMENTDVKKMV